ncbi:Euonymus lectin S3 [Hibiscus trionum]|uniref:Euonymus lectin S3 n=1 Tax=Hibiscus trionum TaxID=183268 RepID=A0A9W7J1L9_HIBTR|nr:Euonymus lectin S3 [Hibiscus trionum]
MRIPVGRKKHSSGHRRRNADQERPPPQPPAPSYYQHPVLFCPTAPAPSYFQHPVVFGPAASTPHYQPTTSYFATIIIPNSVCSCAHQSSQPTPRVDPFRFTPHLVSEQKPTVKIYCKADPSYGLTIRHGKVVLAPSDEFDCFQHWYKDETFSSSVKDETGFPGFSLVNKATGGAIKHVGVSEVVQLVPLDPGHVEECILWRQSDEVRDGYKAIRMANNIRLNLDAFLGNRDASIFNGTGGFWTGAT